jgi:hypothetical protein
MTRKDEEVNWILWQSAEREFIWKVASGIAKRSDTQNIEFLK